MEGPEETKVEAPEPGEDEEEKPGAEGIGVQEAETSEGGREEVETAEEGLEDATTAEVEEQVEKEAEGKTEPKAEPNYLFATVLLALLVLLGAGYRYFSEAKGR